MNIFSKGLRFIKRKIAQVIYFFIRNNFDEFAGNSAILQSIQNLQRIISEEVNSDRFKIKDHEEKIKDVKEEIKDQKQIIEIINARVIKLQNFAQEISGKYDELSSFVAYSPLKMRLKMKMGKIPEVDYVAFENRFRGSEKSIKDRQSSYLSFFKKCSNVLDIGCGRGEFLEILRDNNIYATGIDINDGMVEICKKKGLNVFKVDIFEFLENLNIDEVDGVFCSQVVEHFSFKEVQFIFYLLGKTLKKKGIMLFETVNTRCLEALQMFYLDMTHMQPVDVEALLFIAESYGFRHNTTILSSPLGEAFSLTTENFGEISKYRDYALVVNKI